MSDLLDDPIPGQNMPEFTVSEVSGAVKRTLEEQFGRIRVKGEVGRVVRARSGHMYFDVKDDRNSLACTTWKGQVARLSVLPEEGMEVVVTGKLTAYGAQSKYNMNVDEVAVAGKGALMALLEERKKKFAAEGLFDKDRKKTLPFMPQVIGVVTSPTGAVIRDILHRVADRFPCHVIIWPALVQGEYAAEQVSQGIRGFNALSPNGRKIKRPDLIIVARGGGSVEDLWPFNDEAIIRAVADSEIPVISAVGHETDTTLIDYVSDRRAPTPTGAAEMALPVRSELIERLDVLGARTRRGLQRGLDRGRSDLRAAHARLPKPESLVGPARQRLDFASEKLGYGLKAAVARHRRRLDKAEARLQPIALQREIVRRRTQMDSASLRAGAAMKRNVQDRFAQLTSVQRRYSLRDPRRTFTRRREQVDAVFIQARAAMKRALDRRQETMETMTRLLGSVSHENVLARGFVLVQRMNGDLVRRASDVDSGERLKLQFADDEQRVTADARNPDEKPRIVLKRPAGKPGANKPPQGDLF